jgi:hypothetical protein
LTADDDVNVDSRVDRGLCGSQYLCLAPLHGFSTDETSPLGARTFSEVERRTHPPGRPTALAHFWSRRHPVKV